MSKETSEEIASVAGLVLGFAEMKEPQELPASQYNRLLADAKRLAGSCLAQREDEEFRYGKISMRPAENGRHNLAVTRHDIPEGVTTFVDPDWFDRVIINGIFEDFTDLSAPSDDFGLTPAEGAAVNSMIEKQMHGEPLILSDDMEVAPPVAQSAEFLNELERLINRHSIENVSDTPDFLLAPMFMQVHLAVANMIRGRDTFFASKSGPADERAVETNFSFYVDGWTMGPTDTVGEVMVNPPIDMAAAPYILKSRKLTAFLERRLHEGLSPGN